MPAVARGGRRPLGSLKERATAEHSNTSEVIRDAPRAWLASA
jgi:hypothetical protein